MDGLATLSEQDRQIAPERLHLLQPYLENQVRLRQIYSGCWSRPSVS
jgi:hypothetical protein